MLLKFQPDLTYSSDLFNSRNINVVVDAQSQKHQVCPGEWTWHLYIYKELWRWCDTLSFDPFMLNGTAQAYAVPFTKMELQSTRGGYPIIIINRARLQPWLESYKLYTQGHQQGKQSRKEKENK